MKILELEVVESSPTCSQAGRCEATLREALQVFKGPLWKLKQLEEERPPLQELIFIPIKEQRASLTWVEEKVAQVDEPGLLHQNMLNLRMFDLWSLNAQDC